MLHETRQVSKRRAEQNGGNEFYTAVKTIYMHKMCRKLTFVFEIKLQ
jgi:hypothetical protein